MVIRKASKKDLDGLVELLIGFKEDLTQYEPEDLRIFRREEKSFSEIKRAVRSEIGNKDGRFLVVEEKGKLIGFCYGSVGKRRHMVFKPVIYGMLEHLWVREEYRGKGFASKLKNEFFKWFKEKGCKYVQLLVFDVHPAKKIYEKWGFELVLDRMVKKI